MGEVARMYRYRLAAIYSKMHLPASVVHMKQSSNESNATVIVMETALTLTAEN